MRRSNSVSASLNITTRPKCPVLSSSEPKIRRGTFTEPESSPRETDISTEMHLTSASSRRSMGPSRLLLPTVTSRSTKRASSAKSDGLHRSPRLAALPWAAGTLQSRFDAERTRVEAGSGFRRNLHHDGSMAMYTGAIASLSVFILVNST